MQGKLSDVENEIDKLRHMGLVKDDTIKQPEYGSLRINEHFLHAATETGTGKQDKQSWVCL